MPPPGSAPHFNAGQSHSETAEPYYSNEDVAILHDIVVLAQEVFPKLPERERLPTNALFGAYYDVLSRIGVDTDHDNRYARVLFKIGGQRGPATLYEKFEAVLARMGIEIEFDQGIQEDGEESSQLEGSPPGTKGAAVSERFASSEDRNTHRKQRRNSESSAWDLGIDLKSQPTTRRNSFSTIGKDHSRVIIEKAIFQRGQQAPVAAPENNARASTSKKENTNHDVGAWLNASSDKTHRTRGRSVSTHGGMRVRRQSTSRDHDRIHHRAATPSVPPSEYDLSNSEITAATSTFEEEIEPNWTQAVVHRPAPKPEDLLAIKATLFYQARLEALVKRQLRTWRERACDLQQDNLGLELIAINHDQKALCRSAFDSWRHSFLEERKSKELKIFQARREQQAWESRGNYLLQTSFYHWLHVANFHIRRTALARKLVVSTRVLNAWKDITAVNELKVRRQVLKKFFRVWKRRRATSNDECTSAVQKFEENLVEKVYTVWVRKLWEVKAAKWRADANKRRALFRWIVVLHASRENRNSAEDMRRLNLAWNTWKIWRVRVEDQWRRGQEADAHYQENLLRPRLIKWRKETKIVPAINMFQSKAAEATLRGAFGIWKHRARQEREASAVDRMRIMKEALIVWRYKHRSTILVARVDHRVVAEAFFLLRLREANILFRRQHELSQCRAAFEFWKQRMDVVRGRRWEQEDLARSLIVRKTQTDVLHTWAFRTESKQRLELAAVEYHKPRLLQFSFTKWSERARYLQELDRRSQDANYYLVLTKAIKQWKTSAEISRREKRKAAYARVRRMAKINLVRGVFHTWREQARHTMGLNSQAAAVIGNNTVILGMDFFDRWRARTEEIGELDSLWRENVLQKHFTLWKNRSSAVQALETEAVLTYQEHRESRAVKQWSLLALKIKAQVNYATNLREKNARKNFRKIISYWHQKALQNRPGNKVIFADSGQVSTKAKVEAWPEIEEDLEMDEWAKGLDETGAVSTPLPGYLSTPSKRSERVMAMAARFSTTPKAPLSTPFERQLRAQWSGGLPSLRKPVTRSTLGLDEGFADIPENSMNNDGKP
ncbi:Sfi1 spindle body protein-domain-containing protein [Cadophora sp. MPI-SDFR-AT-0126]|nr:Sfi1 spindle body protein-domain-containing protein [Leotiomycetes sp. MPI-SDFR-AT-0126]